MPAKPREASGHRPMGSRGLAAISSGQVCLLWAFSFQNSVNHDRVMIPQVSIRAWGTKQGI